MMTMLGVGMTAKEEILERAMGLFTIEGYESTGVARIVSEAGVTKPTLYHHFGNKEGLLSSIIERYGKELLKVFEGSLKYDGDVIGSLDQLVIAYMNYVRKYPIFFKLYKQLYQSPEGSDSYRIVAPFYDEILGRVEIFFLEVSKHHTGLSDKVSWMSYSLIGLMDTYLIHHIKKNDLEKLDDNTCRQVAKQFLHGVFA